MKFCCSPQTTSIVLSETEIPHFVWSGEAAEACVVPCVGLAFIACLRLSNSQLLSRKRQNEGATSDVSFRNSFAVHRPCSTRPARRRVCRGAEAKGLRGPMVRHRRLPPSRQ